MPTRAPPPRQLSINVGVEEAPNEVKDVELGNIGKANELPPVAQFPVMTAVINPNGTFTSFRTNRKRLRVPRLTVWIAWFGAVFILCLLAPLPFYVAVGAPNKHIQTYPLSECTITDYHETYFMYDQFDLAIQVTFLDAGGNTHKAYVTHNAADYSIKANLYIQDFYNKANEKATPFPCYYKGTYVTAQAIPRWLEDYSFRQGWWVMAGLMIGWIVVAMLMALTFMWYPVPDDRRTVIHKEVYEGTGISHLEIVDWGQVDYAMRQSLHAFIYAWIVRETGTVNFPEKKVTITNFEIRPFVARPFVCAISSIVAFFATLGVVTLLVFSFLQTNTSVLEVFYCLGVISAIVPSFFAYLFIAARLRVNFAATAEITSKTDNTVVDLVLRNGEYSALATANGVVSGFFFQFNNLKLVVIY